jgi:hypothetical protein
MRQLELVAGVAHQLVDGNVDFARSAAAGSALQSVTEADDYSKTQAGLMGFFSQSPSFNI